MILFSLLTEILLNDYKNSSLAQLLSVLKSAKYSIKICVYSLSFEPIIDLLIDLCLNNDIMIRIITNGENNSKTFFKVKRMQDLLQFGIESKIVNLKEGFMHNKFAIIDDSILINGSLNWTENAIFNNFEDVLITSNSKLVFTYLLKFNSLWSDSSH